MIYDEKNGICLLDKQIGMSSRQILEKACTKLEILDSSKVGYAGTLDPFASGLLLLLSGIARKLQNFFTQHSKEYVGTIFLGASSETDDREGPIYTHSSPKMPEKEEIVYTLQNFQGDIWQKPPRYSAIKIQGKRSHKIAREGKKVEISPRKIQIFSIDILRYEYPFLGLKIHCSAGTYIRSIARDIGEILGCGGYLYDLRRTVCGSFKVEDASILENITPFSLVPLEKILESYPKIELPYSSWEKVRNKQKIPIQKISSNQPLLWIEKKLVALGKIENDFVIPETLLINPLEMKTKKNFLPQINTDK